MTISIDTQVKEINPVFANAGTRSQGRDVTARYAGCIAASKKVSWDIDKDVIQGRSFDLGHKFLPDGLSLISEFSYLTESEKRYLSQIQGRTYANIFGLVERFIDTKVAELYDDQLGNSVAQEALNRFSIEEVKHQELFRRVDALAGAVMPAGYQFAAPDPDAVAGVVLGKGNWAVLGLTLHIELFTQSHYQESIASDDNLSPLFKDVFLYHWQEERQHAILDELEWRRCNADVTPAERDTAVDELIDLVVAVDGILQGQAVNDAKYFVETGQRVLSDGIHQSVADGLLKAYRWQYILSGAGHPHFLKVLGEFTTDAQQNRIKAALSTLM
jgi:hypothetical protein